VEVITVCVTQGRYFISQTGVKVRGFFFCACNRSYELIEFPSVWLSLKTVERGKSVFRLKYSFCCPLETVAKGGLTPSTSRVTTILYNLPARVWAIVIRKASQQEVIGYLSDKMRT